MHQLKKQGGKIDLRTRYSVSELLYFLYSLEGHVIRDITRSGRIHLVRSEPIAQLTNKRFLRVCSVACSSGVVSHPQLRGSQAVFTCISGIIDVILMREKQFVLSFRSFPCGGRKSCSPVVTEQWKAGRGRQAIWHEADDPRSTNARYL